MDTLPWSTRLCVSPRSNSWVPHKTRRPQHFKIPQPLIHYHLLYGNGHIIRMVMKYHSVESMVTYVFALHLKACDHRVINFNRPWYCFWMYFKGPQNFMVSVQWPLCSGWRWFWHWLTASFLIILQENSPIASHCITGIKWYLNDNSRTRQHRAHCSIEHSLGCKIAQGHSVQFSLGLLLFYFTLQQLLKLQLATILVVGWHFQLSLHITCR